MTAELVIVGAGPAGVAAALWARSFGLDARLIESAPHVGGQLAWVRFHPAELPGIAAGAGIEIAATFASQLAAARFPVTCGDDAVALDDPAHEPVSAIAAHAATRDPQAVHVVRMRGGDRITARAVVIVTGQRRRRLGVPGEARLEDHGVSYSARRDRDRFAGRHVAVVGGGDGAFENALLLTEVGCDVTLMTRGTPRARAEFRARVAADARIEVLDHTRVTAFVGDARLEAITFEQRGASLTRPVTGAVIKAGMVPNSEWCAGLARDTEGYLLADARGRTSRAGIWAAGDIVRPLHAGIGVAMGTAAIAVADARAFLRAV